MNLRRDRKRSLKHTEMQEYSQALDTDERTDADERRLSSLVTRPYRAMIKCMQTEV